jgi:hypothetical protein
LGRLLRVLGLVVIVVGAAFLLTESVREDVQPPPPVWTLPLDGPWDGSPDSPTLREGCLDLLRKARDGEAIHLQRLDRRLHALARDREGDHPLARVDAWQGLMREVYGGREVPAAGIHEIAWPSRFPGRSTRHFAVLVPGPITPPAALIVSLPARNEEPAEHLRRCWGGSAKNLIVISPRLPESGAIERWEYMVPISYAREHYPIDDDRTFLAGLGGQEELATRAAASYTSRLAGLIRGPGDVPDFRLRANAAPLPCLRVEDESRVLAAADEWIAGRSGATPPTRDLFPRRIDWLVGPEGFEGGGWWLLIQVDPGAEGARIQAEILADNRIRIRTTGIVSFRVMLNDRLVDLNRAVVLQVNDDQVVSRIPTRSVRRVVDSVESLGDLSAIFPESIDVKVD